jgi:uncharacterized membrane protein (DUF4010 family)
MKLLLVLGLGHRELFWRVRPAFLLIALTGIIAALWYY